MPEIGMTAAMAPETGSHAIIQTNIALRKELMYMGLAYQKNVLEVVTHISCP